MNQLVSTALLSNTFEARVAFLCRERNKPQQEYGAITIAAEKVAIALKNISAHPALLGGRKDWCVAAK